MVKMLWGFGVATRTKTSPGSRMWLFFFTPSWRVFKRKKKEKGRKPQHPSLNLEDQLVVPSPKAF